ncbi:hypothetical protein [Actimicrobium antarcticum]|uniref:Uncharacterized protein n=1 Tax=Actimicrobium antarcticum TaxID=1051899 RepID=A0ABP7SMF8_9BURK
MSAPKIPPGKKTHTDNDPPPPKKQDKPDGDPTATKPDTSSSSTSTTSLMDSVNSAIANAPDDTIRQNLMNYQNRVLDQYNNHQISESQFRAEEARILDQFSKDGDSSRDIGG